MANRLEMELWKIVDACWACDQRRCDSCVLHERKQEFEQAIKDHELMLKLKAKVKREMPLTSHPRIVGR